MTTLLLQPPALKVAEPPLALAILCAHLRARGQQVEAIDSNLEAYLFLLEDGRLKDRCADSSDTALRRALKHRAESLDVLRSAAGTNFARYNTAVRYLNRLLALWNTADEKLTLGDYQHSSLSPFAPEDLERTASGTSPTLFADYFTSRLVPQIEAINPKLIAISINYLHQALPAFELAGLLRRALPDTPLIAGGGLITSWQQMIKELQLQLPAFDHLVFGPGETSLCSLATQSDKPYTLADCSDIAFTPDFSFARCADYLSPRPILPLTASRGCYWRKCLFCPEAANPVHPYSAFPNAQLAQTMRELADKHGVNHIQLTDNAIPLNMLRHLADNANLLKGIHWFGFVRFEKALEDADFVERLAKSGCKMLQLGLESGSQQVLDRLQKGIRLDAVERILANLRQAGIATFVYIMLGTPGETERDAELTLEFLEKHAAEIGFLNLAIMNMPRASGLLENPESYGISATDEIAGDTPLGLYQRFHTDSTWNRASARRFLNQRLLGSAKIKAIVNRTPPLFTSNHALFFADAALTAQGTE